ncbi:hypothetical protein [Thalassobaculum sp.]|uniref:hypothetical protein n=1 Tax=Thalassobaculum sp. TaxID=2022740 RepID=UPI0032EEBD55
MVARELRSTPGSAKPGPPHDDRDGDNDDPLNPVDNTPSELDESTHAEFIAVYNDASANIRFAKEQQWRTVLYFTIGVIAVTTYGEVSRWADSKLTFFLLALVWLFSVMSVLILLSLQWWQGAEQDKIAYITSKWSSFTTAARRRKSKVVSDLQRYGMLVSMILYLELTTIAVTRVFWPYL